MAVLCISIFLAAVGVRALHWRDSHVEMVASKTSLMGVFERYKKEARRILEEGRILYPQQPPERGDARMLAHPPGYSIMLAAIYRISDHAFGILWVIQILCDAGSAMLVFLIALGAMGVLGAHASSMPNPTLRPQVSSVPDSPTTDDSEGSPASGIPRRITTLHLLKPPALWIGFTAGMLVALCPQLAHYSLVFAPDTTSVLPILISVYLIILAMRKPRVAYLAASGALIGVSCWLKANSLALAPFMALLMIPFLFDRGPRLRYSLTFLIAALAMVAPITLRNYIVFHRFIPVSIQTGLSLAEGIGMFDSDGKLGMPRSDREARLKDAEWAGRPDYAPSLWVPDGIERDQVRTSRALAVIRERPFWFMGLMLRRAAFMLRYNDSRSYGWPADTSIVSRVSAAPPFSHGALLYSEDYLDIDRAHSFLVVNGNLMDTPILPDNLSPPIWTPSAANLLANGERLSQNASVTLDAAGQSLIITGDDSEWGAQFASAPIPLEESTDYILLLDVYGSSGPMALKVTDRSGKSTLAVVNLAEIMRSAEAADPQAQVLPTLGARVPPSGGSGTLPQSPSPGIQLQAPFSSGRSTEIRLVISNNGPGPRPARLSFGDVRLMKVGSTATTWTRYPRLLVGILQGILFNTWRMAVLILAGAIILVAARQWRALVLVLAVPVYYLAAQSALTTEYRYILAIHYFILTLAAVALCTGASLCYRAALRLSRGQENAGG